MRHPQDLVNCSKFPSFTRSPIRTGHGRVIGASKILRDISTRKRPEKSKEGAEKIAATDRMAATITYGNRQPSEAVMNLIYTSSSDDC